MPRRNQATIRLLEPDSVYRSRLVQQLINKVMSDGKKSVAEQITYDALALVGEVVLRHGWINEAGLAGLVAAYEGLPGWLSMYPSTITGEEVLRLLLEAGADRNPRFSCLFTSSHAPA